MKDGGKRDRQTTHWKDGVHKVSNNYNNVGASVNQCRWEIALAQPSLR